MQLQSGIDPTNVKMPLKLSQMKPLHAREIVDLYKYYLKNRKEMKIKRLNSPEVPKAIEICL